MRITLPGVTRPEAGFALTFAGRTLTAFAGESLAAALMNAGELALRTTAQGDARGLYCGMGVCGECSVVVDGLVSRACLTAAAPGQRVEPAPARAVPGAMKSAGAMPALHCDVLVIGAGPAGLAAAQMAAASGMQTIVVDERAKAGGQYFKQPGTGFKVDAAAIDTQFAQGAALATATGAAGARLLSEVTVWSAERSDAGQLIRISQAGANRTITARRIVIATGAYERPWPVPGWTLPGVMTTGGAQSLLRSALTAPGKRVLVAGNGPLNIQLADELTRTGIEVVALVEQAAAPNLRDWRSALAMATSAPKLVGDGLRQLLRLRRVGVPHFHGHILVRIEGDARAEHALIAAIGADGALVSGSERRFAVDAVCIGPGFLPQAEMARAIGCGFAWRDGGPFAIRDDDGRSSQHDVFIAGDGGGLGGARVGLAQGVLSGAAAARDLGAILEPVQADAVRNAVAALARARRFQAGLWALFKPLVLHDSLATPDTLLCRCECVDHATVDALIAGGLRDAGSIKRACRVGMGRCQGRYCAPLLTARLAAATGIAPDDEAGFAPRPPFKPLSIAAIAAE